MGILSFRIPREVVFFSAISRNHSSIRNYKFPQIQPGCLMKINRTGVQLHEEGKIFLNLDRKLVKSRLPPTGIYPFTVLSGERHRE